jgi:mannose/fructose/N-acetylgalactosamine-specific phosphotransferase system component IIC
MGASDHSLSLAISLFCLSFCAAIIAGAKSCKIGDVSETSPFRPDVGDGSVNSIDFAARARNSVANALYREKIPFATAVDGLIVKVNGPTVFIAHRAPREARRNWQQRRSGCA